MRQRDAKLTHAFEGVKLLAGPEKVEKIHIDRSNGRVFHDRTLLIQRDPETGDPVPRKAAMEATFPNYTPEALDEKIAEAKENRAAGRRDK